MGHAVDKAGEDLFPTAALKCLVISFVPSRSGFDSVTVAFASMGTLREVRADPLIQLQHPATSPLLLSSCQVQSMVHGFSSQVSTSPPLSRRLFFRHSVG